VEMVANIGPTRNYSWGGIVLDCKAVQTQTCPVQTGSPTKQPTGGADTDAVRLPANQKVDGF
jgi:hypothetical protein